MAKEPRGLTLVGGGLAGLSLGCALRRRSIPVTLHEASTYPRHRVCGEFISGLENRTVEVLGLEGVLDDAVSHQSTVWYRGHERMLEVALPEPARGLSRYALDDRLRRRFVEAGGRLLERSRYQRQEGSSGEGEVWATGRQAVKGSPWIGLKAHYQGVEMAHGLEMHFGEHLYVGLTPVEGGEINVCALVRGPLGSGRDAPDRLKAALKASGLEPLARRLSEGTLVPGSLLGVSALPFGAWARGATVNQPHTGACRLGDAFALIPPFTGNGMTMALQSAETALPSLEAYAWGRQDWASTCRQVHRALHERFRRRLRWARWLHPLLTDTRCQSMLRWGGALRGKPFHWLYHAMR